MMQSTPPGPTDPTAMHRHLITWTLAIDKAADVDVGTQAAVRPVLLAGLDYAFGALSLGAQVDYSAVVTLGARAGGRF